MNESHQKRPIHFAIESLDHENISALLNNPNVDIDAKYANSSPINYLCDQITANNFPEILPCIKMFVKHSANLNIPNGRSMTPVNTILKKKPEHFPDEYKKAVLSYIFNNVSGIDIDSHRNGEARTKLKELWPDREFPRVEPNQSWNFNRLIECLHNEKESDFLHGLNFINESNSVKLSELYKSVENDETLLTLAIKRGLIASVGRMIRTGANVNYSNGEQRPIEVACKCGQWKIVEMLLKSPAINVQNVQMPLLSIVINLKDETKQSENCDYNKCLKLLLAHNSIDINQTEENSQNTALHYAVRNKDADAINSLLSNGAFIGIRSKFNQMSISNIDPLILEQHLDRCIKTNGLRRTDENFEIEFDYKNLVPPGVHVIESEQSPTSLDRQFHDEIISIDYIARSKELKHLIQHPVISSFLFLKWSRLVFLFYLNFAIFAALAFSMTLYIFVCLDRNPELYIIHDVLRTFSAVLLFCVLVREFLQLWYLRLTYLRSFGNLVDIALIVLSIFVLVSKGSSRHIGAAVILLLAYELFTLAGSLPYSVYSTHFVMFKTVTLSFLKSFALYAIIIIAFSLSFFTLLHKPKQTTWDNDNQKIVTVEGDDLNRFDSVQLAVLKTLVMLTGEFDAASIDFSKNFWNYLFFVVFLFVVSTVLFNLLNGLAVSDIQVRSIDRLFYILDIFKHFLILTQFQAVLASLNDVFNNVFSVFILHFLKIHIYLP